MSLLSKFSAVKIDATKTILKGEDLEFCTKVTAEFESAFSFYNLAIEFLDINREANQFIDFQEYYGKIEETIGTIAFEYIAVIVGHFVSKYKVTIDVDRIKKIMVPDIEYHIRVRNKEKQTIRQRIERYRVSLDKIVSLIQDQLGGLTLNEKGEKEIKDNFCNSFAVTYSHRETPRVELSKNRITFERAFYFQAAWSGGYNFGIYESVNSRIFFHGLSFFENGSMEILKEFSVISRPNNLFPSHELFIEHEIALERIKAIRFYKNGKTTIKFATDGDAEEFFRVICKEGKEKR